MAGAPPPPSNAHIPAFPPRPRFSPESRSFAPRAGRCPAHTTPLPPRLAPPRRYEDKRQADVWKEHLGGTGLEDLGIDANASFIEAPKQQQPQAQARAQQAPPQRAPQAAPQADARRGGAAAAGPSKPVAGKEKDASGLVPIILVPSGCVRYSLLVAMTVFPLYNMSSHLAFRCCKGGP